MMEKLSFRYTVISLNSIFMLYVIYMYETKKFSKVFSEQYEEYGSLLWNHIFVGDLWIKVKCSVLGLGQVSWVGEGAA